MTNTIKLAIIFGILTSLGTIGYTLHRKGYNSGYAAAEGKYREAAQTQSEKLLEGLESIYGKYDSRIKELEQKNENYSKVLQSLGGIDCHNADSLHALNQRIGARRKGARTARRP